MIKLIRHGLDIQYYSDNPAEIKKLEQSLRHYVDGAEFSPIYRRGDWDGYYRFYNGKYRKFNYGMLHIVKQNLGQMGIGFKVENDFKPLKIAPGLKIDPAMEGNWRHQREAIISFLKTPYGTLEIPTRAGKTKTAAEIMRLIDFDTVLFVTDTQLLFDQAINDISQHLGISRKQIGRIQGDTFEIKPITVAMIQTMQSIRSGLTRLANREKKKKKEEKLTPEELKVKRKEKRSQIRQLGQYMSSVQFLIVDEVHEYSSDERIATVRDCCNVEAFLCLSATPEKSETIIGNLKIKSLAGPILYSIPVGVLKERGILAQEKTILIMIDHTKNKNIVFDEKDTYDTYEQKLIVKNDQRNNILINVLQILRHLNLKTLVLFQYINHGKHVQRITGDELVTNETKLDQRIIIKNRFLKRKAGILLATNIFNKGLTLPEVEVLYNAGAGKEQSLIRQKKGRTLGTTETKKKALTIDFVDMSPYFSEHSLSRIAVYEKDTGIENILVLDSADEVFYEDLREFIINWRDGE